METLLIRLAAETTPRPEGMAEWQILDANHDPIGQEIRGSLQEAATLSNSRRVVVLAPAEDIVLAEIRLQVRNKQQLLRAIPYALEDELAEDVEALHFALGTRQPDGSQPVAVVSRNRMDGWLEELKSVNMVPHAILPELLCIPISDSNWSIVIDNERAIVRSAGFAGFSTDACNLQTIVKLAIEEAQDEAPGLIKVFRCDQHAHTPLPLDLSVETEEHFDCPPTLMAGGLDEKNNINLLQGEYEISSETARLLRPWRIAAILLGVWLVFQATSISVDYWRLDRDNEALQERIEAIFKETFPEIRRVVNPRVQMEQKLNALVAGGQEDHSNRFMQLLSAGGQAIDTSTDVQIDTMNFRQGRLDLALTSTDLQSLEKIKRQINNGGLDAKIESAQSIGERIDARLTIQGGRQ
ncbi:MAG: type II secretion system protein GspL [Pseudomonadota bacterium]